MIFLCQEVGLSAPAPKIFIRKIQQEMISLALSSDVRQTAAAAKGKMSARRCVR